MDGGVSCSGGYFKLYEELELQEFLDKFMIKSVAAPDRGFSIDRRDGIIEPLNGDSSSSSASPSKTSTIYGVAGTIRLLAVQSTPGLYLSYETDITLNFQRRCKLVEGWMAKPIWKQADPRFVWNKNSRVHLVIEVA
ncbi:hypothetical protein ACFXTH_033013 [Malus domestica]